MWVGSQENRFDNWPPTLCWCSLSLSMVAWWAVLNSTIQGHKNIREHLKESYEDVEGCRGQDTRSSWDILVHSAQRQGGWGKSYGGLQLFTGRAEGQHWALLSGDGDRIWGNGMVLHPGKVRLGVMKRFFSRGSWAWNRLPRARGGNCLSSRIIWTVLSDSGFEFWVVLCEGRSWTRSVWVPSNLRYFMIQWTSIY